MTIANKHDARIREDVIEELRWDTRVSETDVGVEVQRGIVTLSGTVTSWAKKLAAQDAAHRVAGVLDVANELEVRIPGDGPPTDTEIAEHVRHALVLDVLVPDTQIQTTVSHGIVRLTGSVDYTSQREDAALAIRNLSGVRGVINEIRVNQPAVAPHAVRAAIQAALERQAQREAKHVQLDIVDGQVTVTGKVHSWAEHKAIIGAAWGTRGVEAVIDQLHIEP